MILKKPYAFLIKHFKIIHIILLLPLCFVAIKTSNIANFFETMVNNNYVTNEINIASNYINIFLYLALLIIIAAGISIYLLMKEKNKKTTYYVFLVVYYSILLLATTMTYSQLFELESSDAVASTIRLYKDFSKILFWPQIAIILFTLFRGIGFDLKGFNFSKDLEEIELEDEDDEEIEINFGKNSYKYKRTIRKTIREFKYYILENKFVFTCICGVLLIVICSSVYMNIEVYNKKYNLNEAFSMSGLVMSVNDSILTNLNYDGTLISKDNYYLVVKVAIANRTNEPIKIDEDNFRLYINKEYIYPTLDKSNKFVDYGSCYFGESIKEQSSSEYVLVYELDKKQYKKTYNLRVLDSIVYGIGELHPKYRLITLNPAIQTKVEDMGTSKLGKKISLEDTTLLNSTFQLNNYEFNKKFVYNYEKCNNGICEQFTKSLTTTSNIFFIVDSDINLDEKSYYYSNKIWRDNFYSDFVKLEYTYKGKEYSVSLVNKTPKNYNGNLMVLEVPTSVQYAENIKLVITIRNRKATIILNDN